MYGHRASTCLYAIAPAAVSVTPGASNAEGSWTQVASAANVLHDVYWIEVVISGGTTSGAAKNHLLDIGIDNAGGSSYTAVINNIVCGQSGATSEGGVRYLFPFFIKAGSTIAARIQGSNGTAGTVAVQVKLRGRPANPQAMLVGQYAETVGTITNSNGVSLTPGTAAFGSYVSLGVTVKPLWWWQVCAQFNSSTTATKQYYFELSWGDASNKRVILPWSRGYISGTAENYLHPLDAFGYHYVPAGSTIYIRGGTVANATDSGCNAVAVGIGG